ncbi:MAG: hypothetical protein QOF18_1949 [Frankiaceae bacterium]|nr:hypothetical protein [Frankiaceae bacterium]
MQLTRRDLIRGGLAAGSLLALGGPAGRVAAADLPSLRPLGAPRVGPWLALAGSLHDHSTDSDGDSSSEAVTTWLHAHRQELGIDFMTLSDHSDFFPASYNVGVMPDPWSRQGALMQQYTGADFSLLRGFEWTNDQQNHLNVVLSQQWTTRFITGDAWLSMRPFWEWFSLPAGVGGADGLGQFNHPGDKGALNWDDYALDLAAAQRMCTIEVHGAQGRDGRGSSDAGWYWFALAKGWHVSPVMNWDWHNWSSDAILQDPTPGSDYGVAGHLPGQRSVVFAADARPASLRSALLARRTTATETPDLWAMLSGRRHGHGRPGPRVWQGGEITGVGDGEAQLRVDFGSPTEAVTRIDIVGDNGVSPYPYYYGDNADWSANHSQLTLSYLAQHDRYVTSGGQATRKDRIDTPPPGTVLATLPVDPTRSYVETTIRLPAAASPRPDGKHFVYAIAYAGDAANPARCWTAPLLLAG